MDEGTGKAMFVLITIIIFGIFVVIVYWLFEDEIRSMLEDMMTKTGGVVDRNLGNLEDLTPDGR